MLALSEQLGPPAPANQPEQDGGDNNNNNNVFRDYSLNKINITVSAQNCNSLNISSSNRITCTKIANIIKLGTDVIFLSDIRLGKRANDAVNFFSPSYKGLFHSSLTKRGVGILYKKQLDLTIVSVYRDPEENIILIKCLISEVEIILGSIYGPNVDDNRVFLENIEIFLRSHPGVPVIIGGDWNMTVSCLPADINPDTFRMNSIPSAVRSTWLSETMQNFSLIDPFRLLSPNYNDYSYQPFGNIRNNRSRIDFFLVSQGLGERVRKAEILNNFSRKSFDHRPIFVQLGKSRPRGRPTINNRIVSHPLLYFIALLAVYETYIVNTICNPNGIIHNIINNTIDQLVQVEATLCTAATFCDSWGWRPLSPDEKVTRDACMTNIKSRLDDIISLDDLSSFPRGMEDDLFFEEIIKNINTSILRLQQGSCDNDRRKVKELGYELVNLRRNFSLNIDKIKTKEDELCSIFEEEIKDKVQNYIKDDIVNKEKMCPKFLQIAKTSKSESMAVIKDDTGRGFDCAKSRGEYIRNFYGSLYKVSANVEPNLNGVVRRFLGEEICNNPNVIAMQLSQAECEKLDKSITLEELDKALKTSNKKSTPGIDGVSNKVIECIWQLVRKPLLRYAECCFRKGELTSTFRTACIKIIPKKGDLSHLKNW